MIDLDELERLRQRGAEIQYAAALFDAAPELIAMARQAEELRATICIAVTHLNTCPEIAGSESGHRAHLLLRHALIDYADAMQEQKP